MWTIAVMIGLFVSGLLGASCSAPDATVLVVRTPATTKLKSYVVQVQERTTRRVVYHSGVQPLDPTRDLSLDPLRIGLTFDKRGTFLVIVLAANVANVETLPQPNNPEPYYFFATITSISEVQEIDATLLAVPPKYDLDGDRFPDVVRWLADFPDAAARYQSSPAVLDCLDQDPSSGDLLPLRLRAFDANPLARSLCDVKLRSKTGTPDPGTGLLPLAPFDLTCSNEPRGCIDADMDGDPENTDCDDNDVRRFHGNPRPRNCCECTDRASCATNHNKLADTSSCDPKRCDTPFDYDCSGLDVACFTDEDCDGYAPNDPNPSQRDCDDTDARVHPGAKKICEPDDADVGKDWACDGNPQGGCVDCDLDGDSFQRNDPSSSCPTKRYLARYVGKPVPYDCNDDDRGMFPGSTVAQGPNQYLKDNTTDQKGGTITGAMRGLCRNLDYAGLVQDSNCDGQRTLGCPTTDCDADGDGFASSKAGCNAPPALLDCDDNDPRTFPGAPRYCKDNKIPFEGGGTAIDPGLIGRMDFVRIIWRSAPVLARSCVPAAPHRKPWAIARPSW